MMIRLIFTISIFTFCYSLLAQKQINCYPSCETPDTVYLFFEENEGIAPEYLDYMTVREDERDKDFRFGYGYQNAFYTKAKDKGEKFIISKLKEIYFSKIRDLLKIELEYIKCKNKNAKFCGFVVIPSHSDIFKNIYIIEKKRDEYFKYKVLWADIEY